jgi:small subunit ribosomal protein S1
VRKYKKGEEVEAVVLAIDVDKERISLGIKQLLEGDPFGNYISVNDKGSLVKGSVKSMDAKGAVIALGDEVEGYLRASEVVERARGRHCAMCSKKAMKWKRLSAT